MRPGRPFIETTDKNVLAALLLDRIVKTYSLYLPQGFHMGIFPQTPVLADESEVEFACGCYDDSVRWILVEIPGEHYRGYGNVLFTGTK